jgi:hypothetical protein
MFPKQSKPKRLTVYSTEEVLRKLRKYLKKNARYVVSKFEEDRFGHDSISYQQSYLSVDKVIELVSSFLLSSYVTFTVSETQDRISLEVVNTNYKLIVLICDELGKSTFRR